MNAPLAPRRRLPRLLRRLLLALAGACGLLAAGSLDLRAARPEGAPRLLFAELRRGELRAGAGRAEVRLPDDVVLAGYRAFGRSPTEAGPPLHARALVTEVDGLRAGLVLLELMTLPEALEGHLHARAAAQGLDCLIVVATHSHSGPGGYERAFLPQLVLGRFDERVEQALIDAALAALSAAGSELAPATLALGEARLQGLNGNRDHPGEPVDDRATLVRLDRRDGRPIARLLRFAAHPTINPKRIGPDGDWPGFAMDRLEEAGGVAFVVQGAVGDARSEARAGRGGVRTVLYAEQVAEAARGVAAAEAEGRIALGCSAARFDLPPAELDGMVGGLFGPLLSNLGAPLAPRTADVRALRLGELLLIGVPAEPTFPVARRIEAASSRRVRARVVAAAGAYVSYTPEEREMEARTLSARNAWFGAALAPRLERAAEAAAAPLDRPAAPTAAAGD